MTCDPVTVTEGTTREKVAELMERRRIKHLLVVREGKIVGVVSHADLLRAVGAQLGTTPEGGGDDPVIHRRLLAELEQETWFTARSIKIAVKDGVFALEGTVSDEHTREALRVAAQNVAGPGKVRGEVVLLETSERLVSIGL